jgi:hypothetical protein
MSYRVMSIDHRQFFLILILVIDFIGCCYKLILLTWRLTLLFRLDGK